MVDENHPYILNWKFLLSYVVNAKLVIAKNSKSIKIQILLDML
jgi:hypothetical protein